MARKKKQKRYAVLLCKPTCITVLIDADGEESAKEKALVNDSEGEYERLWEQDVKYGDPADAHVADIKELKS